MTNKLPCGNNNKIIFTHVENKLLTASPINVSPINKNIETRDPVCTFLVLDDLFLETKSNYDENENKKLKIEN